MKCSFLSAFLLAILSLTLSQHLCPAPELVEPCECTSPYWPVTYRCENIADQEALVTMFEKSLDYPLHALVIDNSTLLYLPAALMRAKNVTILLISHSKMSAILDEPIGPSYEMQMFQVIESSVQRGIDWDMLKGLRIGQIQIDRTEVRRIGSDFVSNVEPTVTEVTFDDAKIVMVHKEAFSKLTKLKVLSMPHNHIRKLHRSMFPSTSKIRILDFSWNKISDLPDDIFSKMPALTDVFLEGNRIKSFPARTWQKLIDNNLNQVTLADNPIVCDCGIKWYTRKRRSVRVTGKCAEPANLKNRNLIQLSPGDFSHCPK
ncbi:unnamed protein product [Larinioides sclopetarius]|uniref:Uncharacterized protein n=1 Tax=Larinioides sclopetarius TaxID=280406 RepID=A0AAV2BWE2_9ARAC